MACTHATAGPNALLPQLAAAAPAAREWQPAVQAAAPTAAAQRQVADTSVQAHAACLFDGSTLVAQIQLAFTQQQQATA